MWMKIMLDLSSSYNRPTDLYSYAIVPIFFFLVFVFLFFPKILLLIYFLTRRSARIGMGAVPEDIKINPTHCLGSTNETSSIWPCPRIGNTFQRDVYDQTKPIYRRCP